MKNNCSIIYINNSSRAHKILPLLSGQDYSIVYNVADIYKLFQNSIRPSLVLVDSFGRQGVLALLVSTLFRAPLVIRLRGDFFEEAKYRRRHLFRYFSRTRYWLSTLFARGMLLKAKGIIYNSEYLKNKASFAKRDNALTSVVYNPFTPLKKTSGRLSGAKLKHDYDSFVLMSATNMNLKSKVIYQLDRMLTVPASLWEKWDMYWYICGDGALKRLAQERIINVGLEHRIILPGRVQNIADYLGSCHVCIHFTHMDAFPNITLEALFYRKPVITNHDSCGTLEQIMHNKNGLILQDSDDVSHALNIYRNNPELRKQHGDFGYDFVQKEFSIASQKKKTDHFITVLSHS